MSKPLKLAPKTEAFFKQAAEAEQAPALPPLTVETVSIHREFNIELFRKLAGDFPEGYGINSFDMKNFTLADHETLRARIFTPPNYDASKHSTVIFFQGNGMLFDMIESHLPGFVRIALTSSCKIIGIETPLAPEYSAQQINQLSFDVVKTIIEQASELDIDTNNLILAGYSGGGNLVANIATRARDEHSFPIRHLFLLSPSLDFTLETRINSPYAAYQDMDPAGTVESIKPALKLYYQDNDPSLPLISPIFAANLSALPPTTIIIAEFDGCRGDGEAYALRLKEAGVPVEVIICEGQTHLYFMARGVLDDAPDPAIVMGQKIADMNASEH